jgi:putative nucleotidyltransferase with HDIG domain
MRSAYLGLLIPALAGAATGAATVIAAWRSDIRRRRRKEARLHRTLVDLLLNALSAGDAVTERHSRRVADLTDALAATYGARNNSHSTLRLAALLHDMGKIDDRFFQILHSCEPLTPEQRRQIEQHPHESADILKPLERIHPGITRIVEAHHECWDGNGYPRGLKGDEIPLAARVISVADVFDALTQPRAYHDEMSVEEALAEVERGSGSRFDPAVVARLKRGEVRDRWTQVMERGRREEAKGLNGDTQPAATGSTSPAAPSGQHEESVENPPAETGRSSNR